MARFSKPAAGRALPWLPPQRLVPPPGRPLTMADIRGPWHASGAVEALGVFSVIWSTRSANFWAPLHDFAQADQLRLIEACRSTDHAAGYPGAWPEGRAA